MVTAPRGALTYPLRSREGKEELSLGPMAYLESKDKGENSMPSKPSVVPRRMGRGEGWTRVIWRKLDCLKSNLQKVQEHTHRKDA